MTALHKALRRLRDKRTVAYWPSDAQRIDWAYGQAKLSNPKVTREMAAKAVENASRR